MTIDLTLEQRQNLWKKLTPLQQDTLQTFKKYRIQSLFLTENFLKDEEWLFVDFKENPFYPHSEEGKLFCRCGRELKYQFILVSEKTGEKLALGSTHFSQHLGVSPKVAQQVQAGIHSLDRSIDLILIGVEKGLVFPKRYYNLFMNRGMKKDCSQTFLKRLAAFSTANLPLYEEDNQELVRLLKKSGFQLDTLRPSVTTKIEDNVFKKLLLLLHHYEIGEVISFEELLYTMNVSEKELTRWLSILETPKFSIQVKRVNTNYYRIH